MPEDKIFVDTNIIIYAFDVTAGGKHRVAVNILTELWNSGMGVISIQVLQEFFVNVVQKIPKPTKKEIGEGNCQGFLEMACCREQWRFYP